MKRKTVPALLLIGFLVVLSAHGWAATDSGDDKRALVLSQGLYCQVKQSFDSKTGLLIGLCLAIVGLWRLIKGNIGGAIFFLLAGALLSTIPSIAESILGGIGTGLGKIVTQPTVKAPDCTNLPNIDLRNTTY